MAQFDFTITDAQYNQMMAVLDAMRTRLATLKPALAKFLASEPQKVKVKAFAQTTQGRFLREVYNIRRDINKYFDDIGWGND